MPTDLSQHSKHQETALCLWRPAPVKHFRETVVRLVCQIPAGSRHQGLFTVVNMWNSLPNEVVEADTINTFKNHLDKYWSNQDIPFNFYPDLIETGSLPICT